MRRSEGCAGVWVGDAGARRLLAAVTEACAGAEDLPGRLAGGLGAALALLAADPELARLLTVDAHPAADEAAPAARREWITRFGALLRDAVAGDPRAKTYDLPFLADFLVDGVRFQIARLVLEDEAAELMRLLPGTLEALLAYCFEPGEPRRLARAALDLPA